MQKNLTSNKSVATYSLIFVNSIALIGVLVFHWSLYSVLISYWTENIIIGFYTVLKMNKADVNDPKLKNSPIGKRLLKLILTSFFIIHFGLFTFGHGIFLSVIFSQLDQSVSSTFNNSLLNIIIMAVSFAVSHGLSYYFNYIKKEEYKKTSSGEVMFSPYGRVVVMHLCIIFGTIILIRLGYNTFTTAIIVLGKTTLDYIFHNKQHGAFAPKC